MFYSVFKRVDQICASFFQIWIFVSHTIIVPVRVWHVPQRSVCLNTWSQLVVVFVGGICETLGSWCPIIGNTLLEIGVWTAHIRCHASSLCFLSVVATCSTWLYSCFHESSRSNSLASFTMTDYIYPAKHEKGKSILPKVAFVRHLSQKWYK